MIVYSNSDYLERQLQTINQIKDEYHLQASSVTISELQ